MARAKCFICSHEPATARIRYQPGVAHPVCNRCFSDVSTTIANSGSELQRSFDVEDLPAYNIVQLDEEE